MQIEESWKRAREDPIASQAWTSQTKGGKASSCQSEGGVESKDRGFPERLLESERELAGVQLKCALDFLGQA